MDIKDKISPEDKQQIGNLVTECQVLNHLLKQQDAILTNKVQEVLAKVGCSPTLYNLKFNVSQDLWQAKLKEGALILPNRETRRGIKRN